MISKFKLSIFRRARQIVHKSSSLLELRTLPGLITEENAMTSRTATFRKLARKPFAVSALLFAALIVCATPANSGSSDWTISISTKHIPNCLDYPNSKLQPLIRARVKFEQGLPQLSPEESELAKAGYITEEQVPDTVYEDIYYTQSRALGLHRYSELRIRPGTPGVIRITEIGSGPLRDEEAFAAANATARIFLDAAMKKSALRSIFVPRDNFDLYTQGLQRYGFRPVTLSIEKPLAVSFVVSVNSQPAGRKMYLGYGF